jgi:type I restriction enzyme S subunit
MSKHEKKGLVPKLRFPEFWDAGEWEEKPLGKVGINLDSKRVPITESDRIKGLVPYYGASGIIDYVENFIFDEELLCISEDGANLVARTYPIAFSISGKTWVNNHAHVLRFEHRPTQIIVENYLNSLNLEDYLTGMAQPKLNRAKLDIIPIPICELEEQQKIADCLSSIDDLITAQSKKVEALKTHKKGLMQQLFPREGETVPRLRFPEFRDAGEWGIFPLSRFIESLDAGVSVNSGDRPAKNHEAGILKTSAVTKGIFEPIENKVVLAESELQRLKEPVCEGTIIISRMNTPVLVGANAYVEKSLNNIFLPDRLWAAKSRPESSMRFIACVLGSKKGRTALCELATGTSGSMKNITKPDVLSLQITAPLFQEQKKIADCLSSIDDLITAQSKKVEALKTHKKGLMQQLFPAVDEQKELNHG